MHKTLLALIACLVRSTSGGDDRQTAHEVARLLAELAECVRTGDQVPQGILNEGDAGRLQEVAGQARMAADSPKPWEEVLQLLLTLGGQAEELDFIRQAAHTALRLQHLQMRFADILEREKREAIYHFAYGLSHELNNPLANIASRCGVLLQSAERPDQIQLLNAMADSAMRGSEMLGDLMLTARPPSLQLAAVDLEQLKEVVLERGHRWASIRQVEFDLQWRAQGQCQLDREMLCEIVWSVLRNALEASAAGDTVRAVVQLNDGFLEIQVDDDGPGLSQQAMRHCFDPYFSGREAGRGLGLGLAKAKRLATIHGGDVRLENRAGRGCRATIRVAVI